MYDVKSYYRLSNAILYLRIAYTRGLLLKRSVLQLKFIEFISINFRVALPYLTKLWVVTNHRVYAYRIFHNLYQFYTYLYSSIFQSFHTTFNQCLFVSLSRANYFHHTLLVPLFVLRLFLCQTPMPDLSTIFHD